MTLWSEKCVLKWIRGLLVSALLFGSGCARVDVPEQSPPAQSAGGIILTITDIRGTLKPCGCSPDLRRGGVDRIAYQLEQARSKDPGLLVLHAGNLLVDDEGIPSARRAQIDRRVQAVGDSAKWMGLAATSLGEHDIAQGLDWLEKALKKVPTPVIATNVKGERWSKFSQPTILLRAQGVRVGVVGIVPPGPDVVQPNDPIRQAVIQLRAEGADIVIALSSIGLRQAKRLLRKNIGVDVLVAGGQKLNALVSNEAESFHDGWLVQSHIQGSHIGRIAVTPPSDSLKADVGVPEGYQLQSNRRFSYSLQAIGWDLPQHSSVVRVMKEYDAALADINLASVGKLPPLQPGQASYIGVTACLECHEEVQPFWDADRHRIAWDTLVRDGKTFDLECVSCHTTGYGEPGGSILGDLKNLTTVQCESCHGPGSLHAVDGDAELIQLEVAESLCVTCHNPKHSTGFDYDKYRSKLLVPGHGAE